MKKLISVLLAFLISAFAFAGCVDSGIDVSVVENSASVSGEEKTVIKIAGMKGPTSIGLVNIMEADSNNAAANEYEFTVAGTADEITPLLIKGDLDIAAVPANLASVLYNNTNGEIQVLAVNTLGVLYIVTKGETVESVADLRGKTIIATGKGTTPEYSLRYILSSNGIDPDNDVTIDFKSEATEVVAALNGAENGIAMLPQPYVTVAQNKISDLEIALDLNEEWGKINNETAIVTGVVVVRKAFADANPKAIKAFLDEYKESVSAVIADDAAAAKLVVKHGIFDNEAVIAQAIPYCNLTFISGEEMKTPIGEYLKVLYEQNSKSVGGKLPEDDFYYLS